MRGKSGWDGLPSPKPLFGKAFVPKWGITVSEMQKRGTITLQGPDKGTRQINGLGKEPPSLQELTIGP